MGRLHSAGGQAMIDHGAILISSREFDDMKAQLRALRAATTEALAYLEPRVTGTNGTGETIILPMLRAALAMSEKVC